MSKFGRVKTGFGIVLAMVAAVPLAIAFGVYGIAKMAAVVTLDALSGKKAIED